MLEFSEKDGAITFNIQVVPRASRSEIVGEHAGALRVRIAAPPVAGAANQELITTLARVLRIPRGAVEIAAGHKSKKKKVRIRGAGHSAIEKLLAEGVGA
jgi:uncharacterized protein (TIGR00251 family)